MAPSLHSTLTSVPTRRPHVWPRRCLRCTLSTLIPAVVRCSSKWFPKNLFVSSKTNLKPLLLYFTENGTYFCNECDSKFAEEEALKRHTLQVHSDKPYKCDRCQAAFRYKGNLASHKTVHTGKNKPLLLQM